MLCGNSVNEEIMTICFPSLLKILHSAGPNRFIQLTFPVSSVGREVSVVLA